MSPPLYAASVPVLLRYLATVERLLHAVDRDCAGRVEQVLSCRLASDMMTFTSQVETAAYLALRTALPLAERAVPPFVPTDGTLASLLETVRRSQQTISQLDPSAFAHAHTRLIDEQAGEKPLRLPAWEFLAEFALPNFIFHVSMAYAIARSQGCRLGKAQFDGYHVYREV